MGAYKLSAIARNDIAILYEYGIEHFGLIQAQNYVNGLHKLFQKMTNNTSLGRDASEFAKGLLRLSYKSHVIFYQLSNNDLRIVRVLSQRADLEQYF